MDKAAVTNRLARVVVGSAVLAALAAPVVYVLLKRHDAANERQEKVSASIRRFESRCATAGENASRIVKDVDGIVWQRWRPKKRGDQFERFDPYGHDCSGEDCIRQLLKASLGAELDVDTATRHARGYQFVETIDPRDGLKYRYRGTVGVLRQRTEDELRQYEGNTSKRAPPELFGFVLERHQIDKFTARYAIAWDDISTDEDRRNWVAGGTLQVDDLTTGQNIAKRVGFVRDPGLGSTTGFRDPWGWAKTYGPKCPPDPNHTWDFAMKILQPTN
jgi:hypothetical protein